MNTVLTPSILQQNLAKSPGYLVTANGVEAKTTTQYHTAAKRMIEGKKTNSKIDFWKRHLLGVS